MVAIDRERLLDACADEGRDAGIVIHADLEPLAGSGAPVKPAVYAGGQYQTDRRWWGEGAERRPVDAVVIDNVPSEANRLEAALRALRAELGLPEIVLDLDSVGTLPPHLPARLSSFQFPHRQADAYLRDAMLDGERFSDTAIGAEVFAASGDAPRALLEWFPQALLYGFWQSHLGKKRSQAKLARSWVSEIVGYEPATVETRQLGLKGDPLNLNVDEAVVYDEDDTLAWQFVGTAKTGKKGEKLSEIGHGQVPVTGSDAALAGISFSAVEQHATVSFASMRRLHLDAGEVSAAMRALLVALGLVAHVEAFGHAFSLRSGCDLRAIATAWTWLGSTSADEAEPLDRAAAVELFRSCLGHAESVGLPVGTRWAAEPLVLQPNGALLKAIRATYPLEP